MTDPAAPPTRPPWAWLALNAAVATWITFAGIHRDHNSDSLIESLASLYAWTPFFWQQDRVGLLIPWLAQVCPDPVMNTVLQTGLTVFIGLSVPLLLVELIRPDRAVRAAVALAGAAMLVLAPDLVRRNLLFECYYPLALMLGCAGLLVLGRGPGWPRWWRVLAAAGLLGLAHWVYLGVPVWLGPLALVRGWVRPGEPWPAGWWRVALRPLLHPRTVIGCGLIVAAFAGGFELMMWFQKNDPSVYIHTPRDPLPPDQWADGWARFATHVATLPGMAAWALTLLGAAAIGLAVCVLIRLRPAYPVLAAVPVLLVPAAAEFLFLGTRSWVAMNEYHPRYLLGTVASVQALLAIAAAAPLAGRPIAGRYRWLMLAVAAVALFAAATARYGWPAPDRPARDLDTLAPSWVDELDHLDVDAVGGSYWTVWPAVYHVNRIRRDRGDSRFLLGVADRGRVLLLKKWDKSRRLRVAVPNDPKEREWFFTYAARRVCGLDRLSKIGEQGSFEIYEADLIARPGPLS